MNASILLSANCGKRACPSLAIAIATTWFALATMLAGADAWRWMPTFAPALVIPLALAGALWLARSWKPLAASIESIDDRGWVLLHTVRLFALLFLLGAGDTLRTAWAIPAFWGDFLIAITAVPVALLATPADTPTKRRVLMAWNVAGIVDIILAPLSAVAFLAMDLDSMSALGRFPVVLAPTFFVPLVMFGHVVLTTRLLRGEGRVWL